MEIIKYSLLLFLLLTDLSLQIHARESRFFAKTTRRVVEPSPKLSSASIPDETALPPLPPQSHVGYGLYGRDPDQFPNTNNAAYRDDSQSQSFPSRFANVDFSSTESYVDNNYNERRTNNNVNIPSGFDDTEFPNEDRNVKTNIPSSSSAKPADSFPAGESYENKEYVDAKGIPTTFSDEEFDRYERANVPNYSNYGERSGMSDTRFLENGKYFYDVNAERGRDGRGYKESSERYGSYDKRDGEYKNEYQNSNNNYNRENQMPEEFDP